MKYLCIDYGKKKVGIATSDDGGEMAFPCMVIENNKTLLVEIKQLCKELKIDAIVMGESLDQSGKPNPIAKEARAFAVQLEDLLDLPLSFEKENIKSILINKRKLVMIKSMREDLYNEGIKNKLFEFEHDLWEY